MKMRFYSLVNSVLIKAALHFGFHHNIRQNGQGEINNITTNKTLDLNLYQHAYSQTTLQWMSCCLNTLLTEKHFNWWRLFYQTFTHIREMSIRHVSFFHPRFLYQEYNLQFYYYDTYPSCQTMWYIKPFRLP